MAYDGIENMMLKAPKRDVPACLSSDVELSVLHHWIDLCDKITNARVEYSSDHLAMAEDIICTMRMYSERLKTDISALLNGR